jgi:hypothetical protein
VDNLGYDGRVHVNAVMRWAHSLDPEPSRIRGPAVSDGCNDVVTPLGQGCQMDGAVPDVLVLRAWLEPAGKPMLRVRIVAVSPGLAGRADRPVVSTTSIEDACAAVRNWLLSLEP